MIGLSLLPEDLDFSRPRCCVRESALSGARAFVLDNGILTASVLPEYGGRLCSLFYRPANLELLATEFIHQDRRHFTVHGGWCAAFPSLLADGELIATASWDAEILTDTDELVAVRLCCHVDRVSHRLDGQVRVTPGTVQVERIIRLRAAEAAIEVEDILTNRNSWPLSVTWAGMLALRAHPGDTALLPVEAVEVQRGVGPSGNELDFGLLVSTPYQALARDLREGWLGFRLAEAPVNIRLTFPRELLPHAVVIARRNDQHPAENAFRFQPLATPGPVAEDTRNGALILPPKTPVHIPMRLDAGTAVNPATSSNRPGLQLAELISAQRVPPARMALWRVGLYSLAIKTPHRLLLLLADFGDSLLIPEDLPSAELLVCCYPPPFQRLQRLAQRSMARFVGPPTLRQQLVESGVSEERGIALSPGARYDLPGLSLLATPARTTDGLEELGYLVQADNLVLYHPGMTAFLGEFGILGRQFHPQLVVLPLSAMSMADAVHAAKLLTPHLVVPLGSEQAEQEFILRCRQQHLAFETHALYQGEGVLFDGWRVRGLESTTPTE